MGRRGVLTGNPGEVARLDDRKLAVIGKDGVMAHFIQLINETGSMG